MHAATQVTLFGVAAWVSCLPVWAPVFRVCTHVCCVATHSNCHTRLLAGVTETPAAAGVGGDGAPAPLRVLVYSVRHILIFNQLQTMVTTIYFYCKCVL